MELRFDSPPSYGSLNVIRSKRCCAVTLLSHIPSSGSVGVSVGGGGGGRGLPTRQPVGSPGPMLQTAAAAHDLHSCFPIISELSFHLGSRSCNQMGSRRAVPLLVCSALWGFTPYINSLPSVVVLELSVFQTTNQGKRPSQTDSDRVRRTQKHPGLCIEVL